MHEMRLVEEKVDHSRTAMTKMPKTNCIGRDGQERLSKILVKKLEVMRLSLPSSSMEFVLLKDINIADSEKEVEEEIGDK